MSFIGATGRYRVPTGGFEPFVVTGEIVREQKSDPGKLIFLLQLRFTNDGRFEYQWRYTKSSLRGLQVDLGCLSKYHVCIPAELMQSMLAEFRSNSGAELGTGTVFR